MGRPRRAVVRGGPRGDLQQPVGQRSGVFVAADAFHPRFNVRASVRRRHRGRHRVPGAVPRGTDRVSFGRQGTWGSDTKAQVLRSRSVRVQSRRGVRARDHGYELG